MSEEGEKLTHGGYIFNRHKWKIISSRKQFFFGPFHTYIFDFTIRICKICGLCQTNNSNDSGGWNTVSYEEMLKAEELSKQRYQDLLTHYEREKEYNEKERTKALEYLKTR